MQFHPRFKAYFQKFLPLLQVCRYFFPQKLNAVPFPQIKKSPELCNYFKLYNCSYKHHKRNKNMILCCGLTVNTNKMMMVSVHISPAVCLSSHKIKSASLVVFISRLIGFVEQKIFAITREVWLLVAPMQSNASLFL